MRISGDSTIYFIDPADDHYTHVIISKTGEFLTRFSYQGFVVAKKLEEFHRAVLDAIDVRNQIIRQVEHLTEGETEIYHKILTPEQRWKLLVEKWKATQPCERVG